MLAPGYGLRFLCPTCPFKKQDVYASLQKNSQANAVGSSLLVSELAKEGAWVVRELPASSSKFAALFDYSIYLQLDSMPCFRSMILLFAKTRLWRRTFMICTMNLRGTCGMISKCDQFLVLGRRSRNPKMRWKKQQVLWRRPPMRNCLSGEDASPVEQL